MEKKDLPQHHSALSHETFFTCQIKDGMSEWDSWKKFNFFLPLHWEKIWMTDGARNLILSIRTFDIDQRNSLDCNICMQFPWLLYNRQPQQQHKMNQSIIWANMIVRQNMKRQLIHENNLFALRCLSRISFKPCHISIPISFLSRAVSDCVCINCVRPHVVGAKNERSDVLFPLALAGVSEKLIKWLTLMKSICATGFLHGEAFQQSCED